MNAAQPPPPPTTTANSRLPAIPPKPNLTILKVVQKKGQLGVAPVPFLNPDPITCLMGCSNEAPLIVDRQETTTLIDLDVQISSVTSQFCKQLPLQIQPLGQLLELEETGGAVIPYLGFVEVNLQTPGITNYNKDVLLLVIPTMTYSEMVPVMVGSKIIDRVLSLKTKGELAKVTTTWRQAHFGAVMSGSLQLTCTSSDKTKTGEGRGHPSTKSDPREVRKFCLDDIKGPVHTTWKVTIPLFSTMNVWANSSVKGHCMWFHVLTELATGPQLPATAVPTATYGELHPGSSRVPICLCNLSTHTMEIPKIMWLDRLPLPTRYHQ